MNYIVAYLTTAVVFFAIDYVWLSRVALGFYRDRMGALLLDQPNLAAAGAFYLVYVGGIVYFAVVPALNAGSAVNAIVAGALLGLIAYGTYDMTNLSTIRNWSLTVTVVDIAWGTFLTGLSAWAGFMLTGWLTRLGG